MIKPTNPWSETDRSLLLEMIATKRTAKDQIKWNMIEISFPGRTRSQIKSYFYNQIMAERKRSLAQLQQNPPTQIDIADAPQDKSTLMCGDPVLYFVFWSSCGLEAEFLRHFAAYPIEQVQRAFTRATQLSADVFAVIAAANNRFASLNQFSRAQLKTFQDCMSYCRSHIDILRQLIRLNNAPDDRKAHSIGSTEKLMGAEGGKVDMEIRRILNGEDE